MQTARGAKSIRTKGTGQIWTTETACGVLAVWGGWLRNDGLWIVIVGVSWAAETPDSVRPVLASTDAPARFVAWQASRGTDERLACEPLLGSEALLCFRTWEGKKRRWVTTADLKAWETTTAQLRDRLGREAAGYLDEMEAKRPVDMPGTYYQLAHGDGVGCGGAAGAGSGLRPTGAAHLLAAAPTDSVVFVWEPGMRSSMLRSDCS